MEIIENNTNTLSNRVYPMLQVPQNVREESSRNGPVIRFKQPVSICLLRPWERVHFGERRDANPFFHLIEAMAMLAGCNSVALMCHFAKPMAAFSDDGTTYNAFYGTRARERWGDQLAVVIQQLSESPFSRQAVVQLWDPADLTKSTKDKACNMSLLFWAGARGLSMTSFNRSNDAILGGVSGANIVHLSIFHEYVANCLGVSMCEWWHVSNNLHVYKEQPKWNAVKDERVPNLYDHRSWTLPPLLHNRAKFDAQLHQLVQHMDRNHGQLKSIPMVIHEGTNEPFLRHTVIPLWNAWQAHKRGKSEEVDAYLEAIISPDWKQACQDWILRRRNKNT